MFVRDILNSKGTKVYSVKPERTVYDAIAKMDKLNIGALLVVEDDHRLEGILSERDYRSKVILKGRTSKDTKVSEIMSTDLHYVDPCDSVESCMEMMTNKKIRYLPVMEGKDLAGVVSIGDLVKAVISKQEGEIKNLRHYIQGGYPA